MRERFMRGNRVKEQERAIGLMGAMEDEIAPLYARMTERCERTLGGITFYEGQLGGKSVVLCCAGVGKAQAAAATQLLASLFHVRAVIFSGIAGNMSGEIGIGDVVISRQVVYHDGEPRMFAETYPHLQEFAADGQLIDAARAACDEVGVRYLVGKIATGDQFVGDSATKAAIAAKCAPDCVEMEGAAVAHIAAKNDIPFVILRAMSDNTDEAGFEKMVVRQFDPAAYCATAARISAALIARL